MKLSALMRYGSLGKLTKRRDAEGGVRSRSSLGAVSATAMESQLLFNNSPAVVTRGAIGVVLIGAAA